MRLTSHALAVPLIAPFAIVALPAIAQDAEGYWTGTLQIGTAELPVGFAVERGSDSTLSAALDSPSQGAFDIPVNAVVLEDDRLTFTIAALSGQYAGVWDDATQSWNGTWTQAGQTFPLALSRGERTERTAQRSADPLSSNWSLPTDDAIAALLETRIAGRPGAGYVVSVIEGDTARDVTAGDGFDADTVFEIGSITKVFTALVLAHMVLDGTVSLDDPVAKFLPDGARMPSRAGQQITLRHLSQHNSGLPRLPDNLVPSDAANPYADYTEADLLAYLAGHELTRDIGSQFEYSNLGVGLLGYALARAEGTEFATLLRNRILTPLGMDDTAITLSDEQQARFATGHDEYMRPTKAWDLSVLSGAGGMRSTLADMTLFAKAALDPASPIAEAMQLTLSEARDVGGQVMGLGWFVRKAPARLVASHGGGTGGFRTHLALQPAMDRASMVMTNASVEPSARDIGMHLLIGTPLSEVGPVPEAPATVDRTPVTLSEAELDRVVGTYRFAPGMDLAIERRGAQLYATITGQGALPIFPGSRTRFFYRAVNAEITFAEHEGRITGAAFTQDGRTSLLTLVE